MAASVKLVVAVVLAVAMMMAATTAAYYAEPVEDCRTQTMYFNNCLGRGIGEGCCGVVKEPGCFCQLKREAEVQCIPQRRCLVPKRLRIADMDLPCMRNLKCGKHA